MKINKPGTTSTESKDFMLAQLSTRCILTYSDNIGKKMAEMTREPTTCLTLEPVEIALKSLVAEKKKQQNEKEFLADTSNSKALSDWT